LVAAEQGRVLTRLRRPHQGLGDPRRRDRHRAGGADAGARGARVTGVDASAEMLAVAQRRPAEAISRPLPPGDVHRLEFGDRSFDVVISLRVLMHAADWRRSIAELCRVADQLVIIDYPSLISLPCSSRWLAGGPTRSARGPSRTAC
jgi:SAM-dependent methyltransferase